ncbi:MAG: hypothetical protein AAFZ74_02975 [Pseudomonadota bacterium]
MGSNFTSLTLAAACVCAFSIYGPLSHADERDFVVQHDARLRWEHVQADNFTDDAAALTLRLRSSAETSPVAGLTMLAEVEAIAAFLPDDQNGFFNSSRPAIPDAEALELNRLQAELTPSDEVSIILGRQQIALSDERFIGSVNFRQNQQTYDAVTARYTAPGGVTLEAGYVWQVNRFLGNRYTNGTFDSDSTFLLASAPSPIGQITAFRYDLDLHPGTGLAERTETLGVSLEGRAFADEFGVFWTAGFAQQNGSGGEPGYGRAGVTLNWSDVSVDLRYENLGSDNDIAFQTPLATLHKFQGVTDIFVVTPRDGIEDIQAGATWGIGSAGPLRGVRLGAQFNEFTAARGDYTYGNEIAMSASAVWVDARWTLAWAGYREGGFGRDTDKVWFTVTQVF